MDVCVCGDAAKIKQDSIIIPFFVYVLNISFVLIHFDSMIPGSKGLLTPTSIHSYVSYTSAGDGDRNGF